MFLSYCSDLLPLYFPRETVAVHWGTRTKPQRVQCSAWLGDINNSEHHDVDSQPPAAGAAAQPIAAAAQPFAAVAAAVAAATLT
eukprot:scaffold116202_cov50-Phaeocystis_antarctica.AAC.1